VGIRNNGKMLVMPNVPHKAMRLYPFVGKAELIGTTLDRETEYRLLSGVAHGHHWAIQQVGFREIEVNDSQGQVIKALEKHPHPSFILYAAHVAVTSFARVLWYLWCLYGWNLNEVKDLLDTIYERLRYRSELRFWHSAV
jgi:hypothetical protein